MYPYPLYVYGRFVHCTCSLNNQLNEYNSQMKMMQFLMGLADVYESIQNEILVVELLPSVGRAFYLVLQVEKQKEVSKILNVDGNASVFVANKGSLRTFSIGEKKDSRKNKLHCKRCNQGRHLINTCFELISYPD